MWSKRALRRRRTSLFLVSTRAYKGAAAPALLERAVERRRVAHAAEPLGFGVRFDGESLGVLIEVPGRGRLALSRAEAAFAEVWYDAFGDRGIGRCVAEVGPEG